MQDLFVAPALAATNSTPKAQRDLTEWHPMTKGFREERRPNVKILEESASNVRVALIKYLYVLPRWVTITQSCTERPPDPNIPSHPAHPVR